MVYDKKGLFRFSNQTFSKQIAKRQILSFQLPIVCKIRISFFIFSVSGYYLIGPIFSANKSFLLCYTQQCFFSLVFTREPLEHSLNRVIVSAWPASHFSVFDIFCCKMVNLFSNVFECIVSKLHLYQQGLLHVVFRCMALLIHINWHRTKVR